MKKIVILALPILPLLFLADSHIVGKVGSSQYSRSSLTQSGLTTSSQPSTLNKGAIMTKAASLAVPFVKNVGQFDAEVKYVADLFAGRFFLTGNELVYSMFKGTEKKSARSDKFGLTVEPQENVPGKGLAFKEFFVDKKGDKINFKSSGEQQAETVVSYFKGNDPGKWRSGVSSYKSISLGEVFPGIEVKLKASGKNVEKIFYVSPESDVDDIKINVVGVAELEIDKDGRLVFKNSFGGLAMRAPIAWQEIADQRCYVKVGYRLLANDLYGFAVKAFHDKRYPLIIDPELDTLMASTCLGGTNPDFAYSLVLDGSGNVFLSGQTMSTRLPTKSGAYDESYNGGWDDAFISKINSSLTTLLASTYLGGSDWDAGTSLALDSSGNVCLTGTTDSEDFPTTEGAYDRTYNGGSTYKGDVFVSKLDGNLTTLLASTFLGGILPDSGSFLLVDNSENIYVGGYTYSSNFPISTGTFDQIFDGSFAYLQGDAFISKLDGDLTTLLASTFLGGSKGDHVTSLALDRNGNIFVVGSTTSEDFPTTPGAYDQTCGGDEDGYITKLNGNLSEILASTFFGGSENDSVHSVALNSADDIILAGTTGSNDFPTSVGAFDLTYNAGFDAFVSKLDNNLTVLLASTFLGGSHMESECFLALDSAENVYLTGATNSEDFPTTPGAYDRTHSEVIINQGYECQDVFISKLDKGLTSLLGSTFLGGWAGNEAGFSLAVDNSGNVFVGGRTYSSDFPVTGGAFAEYAGNGDVFVAKLGSGLSSINVITPDGGEKWQVGTSRDISWETSSEAINNVRIEVSTDKGSGWNDVIASTANTGNYNWTIPDIPSLLSLIRVSDSANAAIADISNSVFSILMCLDLQAERYELRSLSILRYYGKIRFQAGNPAVAVAKYNLLRRISSPKYEIFRTILSSELQNNQFEIKDRYLEKGLKYTYKVEAYNADGRLVGYSDEKTI